MATDRTDTWTRWPRVRQIVRWGAGLSILVLVWSCGTIPGIQEDEMSSVIRIPFVRVLLNETSEALTITADAAFAIECLKDNEQQVFYSSQPVTIRNAGMRLVVWNHRGDKIQGNLDEVNILPRGGNNRVRVDQTGYRGILRILPHGETIRVVNVVYMEDYLRGVVPPEIGPRVEAELEAIKAQAVAARTYAMGHLKQYGREPFDMKSSIMDQVYQGADIENSLVNRAIGGTTGRVIMHQDKMIDAYYHSTCGGRTDNIADVWDRAEVNYLKSVADESACSWSKYFTWEEYFTEPQLRGRIEQYLSSDRGRDLRISPINNLVISDRTAGGRVRKLLVHTETDVYRFSKDRIRWVVGRTSNPDLILPSDRFDINIERDQTGTFTGVTFSGQGYGHGVGMCQCGAIGNARDGWAYADILKLYYTDVEIKKLY